MHLLNEIIQSRFVFCSKIHNLSAGLKSWDCKTPAFEYTVSLRQTPEPFLPKIHFSEMVDMGNTF